MVLVRGDSGFCTSRILDALEGLERELGDIFYVLGLEKNVRLLAMVEQELQLAKAASEATGLAGAHVHPR